MPRNPVRQLAIDSVPDLIFGKAPKPLKCGRGVELGGGLVVPEINFTLPPMTVEAAAMPEIRKQYQQMIDGVCKRAVELEVPSLLVEFETLPEMTTHPEWGAEITSILAETLGRYHEKHGLNHALRLTPNDTRDHIRPPLMRRGEYWESMLELFARAGDAGADMISIESTGGKEVCDMALMAADLKTVVFALGVLAARDMEFLWEHIVAQCRASNILPAGDTACGFANTAMVLAEQRYIPRLFAAIVRVAAAPRSLVAYEMGAVGPSKDCAYEGPYMKAMAGVPISMEGRTAACAHMSPVGNIAQAMCDCWSNESVQNLKLLGGYAPVVSMEQLTYDCRLLNRASRDSADDALKMRDWLCESDAGLDPQAFVLRPDVVLEISRRIIEVSEPYARTRVAVMATIERLRRGIDEGELKIPAREQAWLDRLEKEAAALPEDEAQFIETMRQSEVASKFLPEEYGLG